MLTVPGESSVRMGWDTRSVPSDKTLSLSTGTNNLNMKTQSYTIFGPGTYSLSIILNNSVQSNPPPASVTNLHNISYASNYINWTWTNPADSDFDKVMIYLNGTFQRNVTNGTQYYNATGLTPNTMYEIGTRTVDIAGNINDTWVNRSATTAQLSNPISISIISPSQQDFAFGTTIDFASLVTGGTSPYTYSWESSRDGIISTAPSFSISDLSMGTHTVTLTVTDANSIKATNTKVITVNGIDLSLKSSDIGFSKPWPMKDEEITLNATITNDGSESAINVNVRFYDNELLIGEMVIPSISHHSSSLAQINYVSNISGYRLIKVVIDEANSIIEADETNNIAIRPIAVGNGNLYGSIDLSASIQTPKYTGEYTRVSGSAIYNTTFGNGENVAGALVTITIEGTSYTTYTTSSGTFSTDIIAPYSSGLYPVSVRISDNTFTQEKSLTLTVNNWPEQYPDLVITQNNITFPQSAYVANVSGTINARIVNIGRVDASGVTISFYDDGVLFATNTIPTIPRYGGSVTTSAPITPLYRGTHSITVKVDVDNSIQETNELNNQASRNLYVYPDMPDFTPSYISYSDSTPYDGQQVTVNAGIRNIGGIDSATSVSFYLDGILKNTVAISVQGRNGNTVASFPMTFTNVGTHQVRVVVDEAGTVQESDEGNNQSTSSIYVHAPQPDLKADDIFLNISSPVSGDSVLVTGIFSNNGETSANNVIANLYVSGLLVNTTTIPTLSAGSLQTITWVWSPISNGYFDIQLSVDPQNTIAESNEYNNLRTETYYVYPAQSDPYPLSLASTPSIAEIGYPVIINAVIKNKGGISTGAMTVKLYDNDSEIFSTSITVPGKDGTAPVSTSYAFASSGTHTIKVKVDPDNAIPEFDDLNNERSNTTYILPQLPDIQIRSEDIYFSNNNPDIDENIVIYANVSNVGTYPANNIVVNFYVDYIFINTTSIPSISNKSFVMVTSNWIAQGEGSHVVGVEAIYGGSEQSGMNNAATRGIVVGQSAIPPASVTDLHNISYASNYINWTWTEPSDPDFAKVMVYLDGVYKNDVLKGVHYYNAIVVPGTYTIGTRTVDTDGNINDTMVTHTATTILPPIRFINGTVVDSMSKAVISGATVSTGSLSTTSNEIGFYSLAVASGSYDLTATFDIRYYTNSSITVSTIGTAVVVQDIELVKKPMGTIAGSVTRST
jgi:subtilase family serine protease